MLKVEKLTIGYGKTVIASNLNFNVQSGMITTVIGSNGAGKTTLIKTLTNLLKPIDGKILLDGLDIKKINRKELAKKLSVVLSNSQYSDMMTGIETVQLGRYPHTNFLGSVSKIDKEIVDNAIKMATAEKNVDKLMFEMSDGERQKIFIARALAQMPEVMILDEPISHLDLKYKIEVLESIGQAAKDYNIAVVMSLHEIDLAIKFSDKIIALKKGQIEYNGTPEGLYNGDKVASIFSINNAGFSGLLCSCEVKIPSNIDCFTFAGGGTGIPLYRYLAKKKIGFVTGVLAKGDVDAHIANEMGAEQILTEPNMEISDQDIDRIDKKIKGVKYIVDCGFELNQGNKKVLEYINSLVGKGIKIYSLREDNLIPGTIKINSFDEIK